VIAKRQGPFRHLYTVGAILGGALFLNQVYSTILVVIAQSWALKHLGLTLLGMLIVLAATVLQIGAWRAIMKALGTQLDWISSLRAYTLPFVSRYIPGTVWGYLSRSHWLKEHHGTAPGLTNLGAVIEVISLIGSSALVACAIGLVLGDQLVAGLGAAGLLLVILGLAVFQSVKTQKQFRPWIERLDGGALYDDLRVRTVIVALPWHIGLWVGYGAVVWLMIGMVSAWPLEALPIAIAAYALAWLAGFLVVLLPAGFGLRELGLAFLLTRALGLPSEAAATVAVFSRAQILFAELACIVLGLLPRWR